MTKYNLSFKQQVIDFYLTHHPNLTLTLTLRQFGLKSKTLRRWIAQFHYSGSKGLAVLRTKRAYSPAFKLQVVQAVLSGEFTLLEKVGRNHQKGRSQTAEVVEALRKTFPLAILLPIANLARSSFFYHNKPKTDKDSEVKARILEIKQKEPHYGYRRVAIKLGGC